MGLECSPANQFCCGCSISTGVRFWLFYHLFQNVSTVVHTLGAIIYAPLGASIVQGGADDRPMQISIALFCLAGIPLIVLAIFGVKYKVEPLVRLYFIYMVCSAVLDWCFIAKRFIISPCDHVPTALENEGHSFACGVVRDVDIVIAALLTGIQFYLIWIVWSFCEDMKQGGEGPELADLMNAPVKKMSMVGGAYGSNGIQEGDPNDNWCYTPLEAMAEANKTGHPFGSFGSVYDGSSGLGGAKPMFHGRFHEMRFPPPLIDDRMA